MFSTYLQNEMTDERRAYVVVNPSYGVDFEMQPNQGEDQALEILDKVVERSQAFRVSGERNRE